MNPPVPSHAGNDRHIAAAVGLLLLAIYLATSAFQFHSIDEFAIFTLSRNLAARGSIDGDVLYWAHAALGQGSVVAPAPDGHTYIAKDGTTSILILPAIWLSAHSSMDPERASLLLTPVITALTAGVLYLIARSWGAGRRSSLIVALLYGLASIAWPYAESLFTQPIGALGLLLALHGTIHANEGHGWRAALLAGLGVGLAGVSALPVWVTLPIYPLYWLLPLPPREWIRKSAMAKLVAFGVGAGAFLLLLMAYNMLRFGGPLNTGHQQIGAANFRLMHLGVGMFGQLLSTPRGLVWYVPPVLLVPFGLWFGWRSRLRPYLLLALAQFGMLFLLIAGYASWWGGLSWGPRYLIPVMPAMILLSVPLLQRVFDLPPDQTHRWAQALVACVLLVGALTQFLGSVFDSVQSDVPLIADLNAITPPPAFFFRAPILTNPAALPLLRQVGAARSGLWDLLPLSQNAPDWLLLSAQIGLVIAAMITLFLVWRDPPRARQWGIRGQSTLTLGLCILILLRYPADSRPVERVRPVVAAVDPMAQSGDGLLVQLPESIFDWMRVYPGTRHDIGIMPESPLSPETAALLQTIPTWHDRVWLIEEGTFTGDPANGVQRWLADHAYAGTGSEIDGIRLTPYAFWQEGGESTGQSVNAQFGDDPILLQSFEAQTIAGPSEGWINVRLIWSVEHPPLLDYSVFVHLLNADGVLVAQHDGPPGAGYAPTTTWGADQRIADQHSLLLPADLPAGDYTLAVGLYNPLTGERLALDGGDSLPLTVVHLPNP